MSDQPKTTTVLTYIGARVDKGDKVVPVFAFDEDLPTGEGTTIFSSLKSCPYGIGTRIEFDRTGTGGWFTQFGNTARPVGRHPDADQIRVWELREANAKNKVQRERAAKKAGKLIDGHVDAILGAIEALPFNERHGARLHVLARLMK